MSHRYLYILVTLPLLLFAGRSASAQDLVPYTNGTLWGYADRAGRVVLQPRWSSAHFFAGDRASVWTTPDTVGEKYACIINRHWEYIVPPSRRWNGQWNGFGLTGLNMTDESGRRGMVDTANRLLIPCAYEERLHLGDRERFAILKKDGRWGVLNRAGEIIIPFKWEKLLPVEESNPAMFLAADSAGGQYAFVDGKGIQSPHRYSYATWSNTPGVQGFVVHSATGTGDQRRNALGFVRYPSMREVVQPIYRFVQPTPSGKFIVGINDSVNAILDSAGNLFLRAPAGHTFRSGQDTILQERYAGLQGDSMVYFRRPLDGRTLAPLSDWYRETYYFNASGGWNTYGCGTGLFMAAQFEAESKAYENRRPALSIGGEQTKDFVLRGQQWSTTSVANTERQLVGIASWWRMKYSLEENNGLEEADSIPATVYAVVDSTLRIQFSPLPDVGEIEHYNPEAGLIVCRGSLFDTTGRRLAGQAKRWARQAVVTHGQLFLLTAVSVERGYDNSFIDARQLLQLCDTKGNLIQPLAPYLLRCPVDTDGFPVTNAGTFLAIDSLGRQGFVDIRGTVVWPQISFRYTWVQPLGKQRFFLTDRRGGDGMLATGDGRNLTPRLAVTWLTTAESYGVVPINPLRPPAIVPGLWSVWYQLQAGSEKSGDRFFMDTAGRIFTNGFER